LNIFLGIEFVDGVNKAKNTGVDEVIERDVRREPVVDTASDVADFRKILFEEATAFFRVEEGSSCGRVVGSGQHEMLLLRSRRMRARFIERLRETER
jgi:hypothetical protein